MASPKTAIRWTAVVVALVYGLALRLSGLELDDWLKQALSYLPATLALAVVAFDKWLWRLPILMRLHRRPRIDGLWRVEITPAPASRIPDGGNKGPIEAYVVIQQTYWSVDVTLLTEESRSDSRAAAFLRRSGTGRAILSYTYDAVPRQEHRDRSPLSAGAADLNVPAGVPTLIEGSYFTNRFTAGSMTLTLLDRSTSHESFGAAEAHANQLTTP